MAMPMRGELPIGMLVPDHRDGQSGSTWNEIFAKDADQLLVIGVFTVIGLAASFGFAIAFPTLGDSAALFAQFGG